MWVNGMPNGKGQLVADCRFFPETYDGEFHGGLKYGEGNLIGLYSSYSGNYVKNMREGFGELISHPIDVKLGSEYYSGNWHLDKRNGTGNLTYANGDNYFGDFKDDQPDGFGIYIEYSGITYTGNWKESIISAAN